MWKKKWKNLKDMPNYSFSKQVKIVVATMTLHNYITRAMGIDIFRKSRDIPNGLVLEENQFENHDKDESQVTSASRNGCIIRSNCCKFDEKYAMCKLTS